MEYTVFLVLIEYRGEKVQEEVQEECGQVRSPFSA